jgi:hypothetical protein
LYISLPRGSDAPYEEIPLDALSGFAEEFAIVAIDSALFTGGFGRVAGGGAVWKRSAVFTNLALSLPARNKNPSNTSTKNMAMDTYDSFDI